MDLRGISDAHRRLRKSHEAIRFGNSAKRANAASGRESDVEEYLNFRIHYHQRTQGVTMPRSLFSVVIEGDTPRTKIYLSGFPNRADAQKSARSRIDAVVHQSNRRTRTRNRSVRAGESQSSHS